MANTFSVTSSTFSGNGSVDLVALIGAGDAIPVDGAIMYRYTAEIQVASVNTDLIWNQVSAETPQYRAGRVLTMDRVRSQIEAFIARPFNRIDRLSLLRYTPTDLVNGGIGTGKTQVILNLSEDGYSQATALRYELFDGVTCRLFLFGTEQVYYNPEGLYRFIPIGGTLIP